MFLGPFTSPPFIATPPGYLALDYFPTPPTITTPFYSGQESIIPVMMESSKSIISSLLLSSSSLVFIFRCTSQRTFKYLIAGGLETSEEVNKLGARNKRWGVEKMLRDLR